MSQHGVFKLRLVLTPAQGGGFVVTCPDIPELITEGDTAVEALANVRDAVEAVRELYQDLGRPLPPSLRPASTSGPLTFETLIDAA